MTLNETKERFALSSFGLTRVLVTGGSGFIGNAVCSELAMRGIVPVVFDVTAEGRYADIRDQSDVLAAVNSVDGVIHLAGLLGTDELYDNMRGVVEVNIGGGVNLLEALRVKSNRHKPTAIITQPHVWVNPYQASKQFVIRVAGGYVWEFGINVRTVTVYNAFGPGQKHGHGHPKKIIPSFATAAWAGMPMEIHGDGSHIVDLAYVSDVATRIVDSLGMDLLTDVHAGSGEPMNVFQVAAMIGDYVAKRTGQTPSYSFVEQRRGETGNPGLSNVCPPEWAMGFDPDALAATVESYRLVEE